MLSFEVKQGWVGGIGDFIYSFSECFLSTCYVTGAVLGGSGDARMSTEDSHCPK